jgi:hypothetical protein
MTELPDTGNDGYASNDTINVVNATSHVNVYLVAHYKEGNNPEELRIIDNKLIRVIPTADGTKGDKGDKGDTGTFSEAEKNALIAETLGNIENAYYSKTDIDGLRSALEQAIANGDQKAIADASAALNMANSFNAELDSLKSKFKTGEDGKTYLDKSVLNEADIYDLSVAALGNDIEDSEGTLHENAIFAKQIVGVISTFGSVKADNITGDVISGKTIKSTEGNWELREDGSATLGSGGIEIASDGSVTFGPNVKLT